MEEKTSGVLGIQVAFFRERSLYQSCFLYRCVVLEAVEADRWSSYVAVGETWCTMLGKCEIRSVHVYNKTYMVRTRYSCIHIVSFVLALKKKNYNLIFTL